MICVLLVGPASKLSTEIYCGASKLSIEIYRAARFPRLVFSNRLPTLFFPVPCGIIYNDVFNTSFCCLLVCKIYGAQRCCCRVGGVVGVGGRGVGVEGEGCCHDNNCFCAPLFQHPIFQNPFLQCFLFILDFFVFSLS